MNRAPNTSENTIKQYILEPPSGVYPLNGDDPIVKSTTNMGGSTTSSSNSRKEYIYPDFDKWSYKPEQDAIMQAYLQKGYFESPSVGNELLGAKNSLHSLLHADGKTNSSNTTTTAEKMDALSDTVVSALYYRRNCNKSSMKYTYKPPPRVTLTEYKKEIWLKNLANPTIPLSRLSRTIPHGIRNKVLLDQCCLKQIPIRRALWFIKCVGTNELRGLKRKGPSNNATSSTRAFEQNWIDDWTVQVTDYLEKLERDCFVEPPEEHGHSSDDHKLSWRKNMDYMVKLVAHLYMNDLISREAFAGWIVHFMKIISASIEMTKPGPDLKLISVHMIFLRLFWLNIVRIDHLAKEISETLLLVYMKLQEGKILTKELCSRLSKGFKYLIVHLFYYNSSSFIMSNHWTMLKPTLKKLINMKDPLIQQQFDIITYRNESLLLNSSDSDLESSSTLALIKKADNFSNNSSFDEISKFMHEESLSLPQSSSNSASTPVVSHKNNSFAQWRKNVEVLLKWSSSMYRRENGHRIYLVISLIKSFCAKTTGKSALKKLKAEIENLLLEFIYSINDQYTAQLYAGEKTFPLNLDRFLLLLNELYQAKFFTVSSYLRRLISSGIIYLPNAQSKTMLHIMIIQSLPIRNNPQCASILKSLAGVTNYQSKVEESLSKSTHAVDSIIEMIVDKELNLENQSDIIQQLMDLSYGIKMLAADYFLSSFRNKLDEGKINLTRCNIALCYTTLAALNNKGKFFTDYLVLILSNGISHGLGLRSLAFMTKIINADVLIVDSLCTPSGGGIDNSPSLFVKLTKMIADNYKALYTSDPEKQLLKFWEFATFHIGQTDKTNFHSDLVDEINNIISDGAESRTFKNNDVAEPVKASLKTIGLNLSVDQFLNYDRSRANTLKLLEKLMTVVKRLQTGDYQEEDLSMNDTVIKLLKVLQIQNEAEFVNHIIEFCNASMLPSLYLDLDTYLNFSVKLVVNELIDVADLVDIFDKENSMSDNITGNPNHRLIWYLLLENKNNFGLSTYEACSFEVARHSFSNKYPERTMRFISMWLSDMSQSGFGLSRSPGNSTSPAINGQFSVHGVDNLPTPISNNVSTPLPMLGNGNTVDTKISYVGQFEEELSLSLNEMTFAHGQLLVDTVISQVIDKGYLLEIFNGLLLLDPKEISTRSDLGKLVDVINIFNFPLCQIVLKIVWDKELGEDKNEEFKTIATQDLLISLFNKLVKSLHQKSQDEVVCFNQMFNMLGDSSKLAVLNACKSLFLRSEHFPQVHFGSEEQESLVPHLNEIINNCSRVVALNQSSSFQLDDSLVFSLNAALEKLIYCSDKLFSSTADNMKTQNVAARAEEQERLLLSINLLLKIVLIHKNFLVDLILRRSNDISHDSFIKNLGRLFKCKILRCDSKLRNYFYDGLASIEQLVNETVTQDIASKAENGIADQLLASYRQPSNGAALNIFNLPPLSTENVLAGHLAKLKYKDALIEFEREKTLSLYNEKEDQYEDFKFRAVDLIEEANPIQAVNNTSISLQLFNASVERKNPS